MRILGIAAAAVFGGLVTAGPGWAADLKPVVSQAIDLGGVAGDAYYTVQPDGYHVVATFAPRGGVAPVRFRAVLANGQAVVFSAPRGVGEQPVSVSIRRADERVVVVKDAVVD